VAKRWDRFACLEPNSGVRDRFGQVGPDVARGIRMCHDLGPQDTSGHFQGALKWLWIEDSPAFMGEPRATGAPSGSSGP